MKASTLSIISTALAADNTIKEADRSRVLAVCQAQAADDLLTIREAAKMCRVSHRTMERYVHEEKIPSVLSCGKRMVSSTEVQLFRSGNGTATAK